MSTVTDWEDELECDIETSESGEIKIENSPGQGEPVYLAFQGDIEESDHSIRIINETIGNGLHFVKSLKYTPIFPEYPATSDAGFAYVINVQGFSEDEIKAAHQSVHHTT